MGSTRDLVEQFYKGFEAADWASVEALCADDCKHVVPMGAFDNAMHSQLGQGFRAAFPDAAMHVRQLIENGDEVVVRGAFRGTHTGDLVGEQGTIPASGKPLDMPFMDYFRVANGKLVEHEVVWDQMGMLAQIGALPG